jgi:hypothetical protein
MSRIRGVLVRMIGFITSWATHSLVITQTIQRYLCFTPITVHRCARTRILSFHLSLPSNGSRHKTVTVTFVVLCVFHYDGRVRIAGVLNEIRNQDLQNTGLKRNTILSWPIIHVVIF